MKGLESKFGPKTDLNEREFRSFFDKIIQLPFSMPMSAYNIERLLLDRLRSLGIESIDSEIALYKEIATYTVGSNPRSIKRYLNTYSLLRRIALSSGNEEEFGAQSEVVLFALIGLQIAYPKIYQLLLRDPEFVRWDQLFADRMNIVVAVPEVYRENDLFDESWEQIIWSYCQKDIYLRTRSVLILRLLNLLRRHVGDDEIGSKILDALQIANITSVSDSEEAKHDVGKRVRFDDFQSFSETQRERGVLREVISVLDALHKMISTGVWSQDIYFNYTPIVMTANARVPGRRKVFAYISPRKKSVRLGLRAVEGMEEIDLYKSSEVNSELRDRIAMAIDALCSG